MEVKGEVRDVQATLVPDMQIIEKAPENHCCYRRKRSVQIHYRQSRISHLQKSGYQTVEIEVNNMNVINITVNYGEN